MIIECTSQVSQQWLQKIIQQFYPQARIQNYSVDCRDSQHASNAIVRIRYDGNNHYPTSFFLKICKNCEYFITDSEYNYYQKDYIALKNAPIPICYDAQYDNNGYHLLLQDLSSTHYCNQDIEPTQLHARELAQELACLHAHYWQKDLPISSLRNYIQKVQHGLPIIMSLTSLSSKDQDAIRKILDDCLQKIYDRQHNRQGFSKIHGDVNPCNVLSPYNGGKTYIIDRQPFLWSLTHFLGVYDLAYAIIPFWTPEKRRELEMMLLQTYHCKLREFGVQNYSWEQCIADYKLCIVLTFYVPISWGLSEGSVQKMQWLWEKQLRRSLQAFREWW